ncbi:MAG: hypothetical protein MJZ95_01865 [Paludibacteraceae bacterium]|nr:hypothetical protein [Paludibacteraceae bacterium]
MKKTVLVFNLVAAIAVMATLVCSLVYSSSFWADSVPAYLNLSVEHSIITLIVNYLCYYLILCFLVWAIFSVIFYNKVSHLNGNNSENFSALVGLQKVIEYVAVFTPLPMAFFAKYTRSVHRGQRNRIITCPDCGKPMRVLSEEEEDAFLNENQQFEETLNSLDYDVWLCPDCGKIQVFCYKGRHSRMFRKCPKCNLAAMKFVKDEVLIPATSTTEGTCQRTYECQSCGNIITEKYSIPANTNISPCCNTINIKK